MVNNRPANAQRGLAMRSNRRWRDNGMYQETFSAFIATAACEDKMIQYLSSVTLPWAGSCDAMHSASGALAGLKFRA
jgi:hypothetical protein